MMCEPDSYELWKRGRCQIEPPNDFADKVMQGVDASPVPGYVSRRRTTYLSVVWRGCVAASIALVCIGLGLLRVQAFVVLVLSTSSEGF